MGRALKSPAVPAAAWTAGLSISAAAAAWRGLNPLDAMTWCRWDSAIYLDIAARGYRLVQERHEMNGRVTLWGGNCVSSPLYPWLIRAASALGAPPPAAGLLLSAAFHFLTLAVLWHGFLEDRPRPQALLLMAAAAVFPGMVYQHAVSPVSLLTLLALCQLLCLLRGRWGWAAAAGILAGMSHGAGIFLMPATLAWLWLRRRELAGDRLRILAAALAPAAGVLAVLAVQRWQTGAWDAAFKALEFHRHGPWSWTRVRQMLYIPVVYRPTEATKVIVLAQSAAAAALCLGAARLRALGRLEKSSGLSAAGADLVLLYALVFWLAPHASGYRHGYYRVEAFLLPALILLAGLPKGVLIAMALLFAALAPLLTGQFLASILV